MAESFENVSQQIMEQLTIFMERHNAFIEKGNKSAGKDARMALGKIKNLTTNYRKLSVDACKK